MTDERRRRAASLRRIADASTIGLAFPIAILLGYLFGKFLDRSLGIGPWGTWVFTAMGVAAGFLNAIRMGVQIGREEDDASRRGNGS